MVEKNICFNCFKNRGGYEVCPYCGYVADTPPEHGYHLFPGVILHKRYIIGTVMGFGGFGITYKSWDTILETTVAIKEFYPSGLVIRTPGESKLIIYSGEKRLNFDKLLLRFSEEAINTAKFNGDPHIVNIFDSFSDNNTAYMVMEFLDGISLKNYTESCGGVLDTETTLIIIKPIIEALTRIHEKGLVHMDISPDNILITSDNKIKIIDLGAARAINSENDESKEIIIKVGFAPPEQYRTKSRFAPYTDVYAVGATLFKTITGITPIESITREKSECLKKPSEYGYDIDKNLEKIIMKALAIKQELRFNSMPQLYEALFNNKNVDFPEDELNKRKRVRILVLIAVAASFFTVIISSLYYVKVILPSKIINITTPETITIALPIIDNIDVYEQYTGYSDGNLNDAITAVATQYESDNQDIKLELIRMPAENYYNNILAAIAAQNAPDLFFNVYNDIIIDSISVVLDRLLSNIYVDDYLFLPDYETFYPKKKKLPLGFHTTVVYADTASAFDLNIELPTSFNSISNLMSTSLLNPGKNYFIIDKNKYASALSLFGNINVLAGNVRLSIDAYETINNIRNGIILQGIDTELTSYDFMESGTMLYLIGDSAQIREVQRLLPGHYDVLPLVESNRINCRLIGEFSVNKNSSKNKQEVSMQFLIYSLSENIQNIMNIQNDYAIPLNKNTLNKYIEINPDLSFITEYTGHLLCYGQNEPIIRDFNNGVLSNVISNKADDNKREQFLSAFQH